MVNSMVATVRGNKNWSGNLKLGQEKKEKLPTFNK